MKKQGTSEHGNEGTERLIELLQHALPPVANRGESTHDLWPAMRRKLRAGEEPGPVKIHVPWFDWALGGALVASLALFPAWIPVLLYYL